MEPFRSPAFLLFFFNVGAADIMNRGGIPYSIGNGDDSGAYAPDFSGLGEYFEVYSEVQTRYSQVYWTRNDPVPMPAEIVSRFQGKVMAITGYEADQVMQTPEGDKSVPVYHAYNHHYFAWLTGVDAEMHHLDRPKMMPNPTHWEARDKPGTDNGGFPTNIVFKENPGGEYRKSFHGYPQGYAQLIHSPNEFVLEPMQIDTHNREFSPMAYNASGHKPWFLPKMDIGQDATSGLNPLIECPCTDRVTRSLSNESSILVKGSCQALIKTEAECAATAASVVPNIASSSSVTNSSLPSGCLLVPTATEGSYAAVFNLAQSAQDCGDSASQSSPLTGQASSLVNLSITKDGTEVKITMTGPSTVWFGVGFDAANMADLPYAIIVDGAGAIVEQKMADHGPGELLDPSVKVVSNAVVAGSRTVVLTRPAAGASKKHYTFSDLPGKIGFINAVGTGSALAYHKAHAGAEIFLVPTQGRSCLCQPVVKTFLSYMETGKNEYNVECTAWPRGDMALQHNPACKMETYHGGTSCCHHGWFLTDRAQESLIPEAVDIYYLKFRFYFQEYMPASDSSPASHQRLVHWVFLIDAQVNDYEEVPCADGTMCEGSITAHLKASDMGLEETPAAYSGMTPLVIAGHCHAPSCIREELYNADTGDLLCRVEAQYGTGNEVFNERDYEALPPCLFGHQPGLRPPVTLTPDTNLRAIKVFNNSFRHVGQMAQWTGLLIYQTNATETLKKDQPRRFEQPDELEVQRREKERGLAADFHI